MQVLPASDGLSTFEQRSAELLMTTCNPIAFDLSSLRMASAPQQPLVASTSASPSLSTSSIEEDLAQPESAPRLPSLECESERSDSEDQKTPLTASLAMNASPSMSRATKPSPFLIPSLGRTSPTPAGSPATVRVSSGGASFTFFTDEPNSLDDEQDEDESDVEQDNHETQSSSATPFPSTSSPSSSSSNAATSSALHKLSLTRSPKRAKSSPALSPSLQAAAASASRTSFDFERKPVTSSSSKPLPQELDDVGTPVSLPRQMSDSALVHSLSLGEAGMSHRREQRYRALLELVYTEEGYVRDLKILVHIYLESLTSLPGSNMDANASIRRNAASLLSFHDRLHASFSQVQDTVQWQGDRDRDEAKVLQAIQQIANILASEADCFELYEEFCSRHTDAMSSIREYEQTKSDWISYEQNCSLEASLRFSEASQGPRLRIRDYAIKPIQRICRYPLMLGQLEKLTREDDPAEADAAIALQKALLAVKNAAESVDAARVQVEAERRSALVARRLDVPLAMQSTFLSVLGSVSLVGGLYHVQYPTSQDPAFKVKYFGALLYTTHLVLVKVKRADCYEVRHWLPLRALSVDTSGVSGCELPFTIKLVNGTQSVELATTCAAERDFWRKSLEEASETCKHAWEALPPADRRFDETALSSLPLPPPPVCSPDLTLSPECGSVSDEDASFPTRSPQVHNNAAFHLRSRLSQSSLSILRRTPSSHRAAIDSRLADVFSDECAAARRQFDVQTALSHKSSFNRDKDHRRQLSMPPQRGTSRDPPDTRRRKSFTGTVRSLVRSDTLVRRQSTDISPLTPVDGHSDLASHHRQRSFIRRPNLADAGMASRRSWTGSLRSRTRSMLHTSPQEPAEFAPPASVERNGSHSSSGSSQPETITPSLSPTSSAPPSPLITPDESSAWGTGFRGVFFGLSRKSSMSRLGPSLGSDEQDAQALSASDYIYGNRSQPFAWKQDSSPKVKRSGLTLSSEGRRSSSSSLLSIFKPNLSPTLCSPPFERPDPFSESRLASETRLMRRDSSASTLNTMSSKSASSSSLSRKRSISAFKELAKMTVLKNL